MLEPQRICDGENKYRQKHRFSASEGFRDQEDCPICGRPMKLMEVSVPDKRMGRSGSTPPEAMGLMRGKKIDTFPRFSWFEKAVHINNKDQTKAGTIWNLREAKKLLHMYKLFGDGNEKTWKNVADEMGRSLYAVERQLRIMKYCEDDLEKYYPDC